MSSIVLDNVSYCISVATMVSTVKNTAHSDHILEMMEHGLSKGCFSDVVISVTGSKKTILCHKHVLARSSPFMARLLNSLPDQQEQTFITLCDMTFSEAMAMLNLVYVGSVKLGNDKMETTRSAAKTFLDIIVDIEKFETKQNIKSAQKRKLVSYVNSKVNSKRPLMIKSSTAQSPIFFVMPSTPAGHSPLQAGRQRDSPVASVQDSVTNCPQLSDGDVSSDDLLTMNSYQRAKLRCADKFKCDLCGKGFPLSCLLQRHKRTHSDLKPFSCNYCEKSFSSKTSLNHHLFMKHLEEQTKRIEMGKKLIESLKQKDSDNAKIDLIGPGKPRDTGGRVIKRDDEYNLSDHGRNIENMEIIGVQDITQQIAVQMGKEKADGCIDAVEVVETVDNLYYIDSSHASDYWDYKA